MIRIVAYIKPHRLEPVKSAVAALGVTGMNVADVRGAGNSPERASLFSGDASVIGLPIRSRIEVVAEDALRDEIVDAIVASARTGEPGDGKIFVERIVDAVRIRTSERGDAAI
jgi:nitrogen regulatory protein P-II 1